MLKPVKTILIIIVSMLLASSCQRYKETFDGGYIETKPESDKDGVISSYSSKPIPPIFSAKYRATLKPTQNQLINLVNCTGDITLDIIEDMGQSMSGVLDCGIVKKDLAGMNQTLKKIETDFKSHKFSHLLTRKHNTENVEFNPPRIYMLAPLIQDEQEFIPDASDLTKNFYYKEASTLTAKTPNGLFESNGHFEVVVHGKETYKSQFYPEEIDVIVYSVNTEGFENLNRNMQIPGGSLYRSMKFWYSSRPIVIPRIEIKLTLNELPGEKDAKFTNWLTGIIGNNELTLTLEMMEYNQFEGSSDE